MQAPRRVELDRLVAASVERAQRLVDELVGVFRKDAAAIAGLIADPGAGDVEDDAPRGVLHRVVQRLDALHRDEVGGLGQAAVALEARRVELGRHPIPDALAVRSAHAAQRLQPPRLEREIEEAVGLQPMPAEQPAVAGVGPARLFVDSGELAIASLRDVVGHRHRLERVEPLAPVAGKPVAGAMGLVPDGGLIALATKKNVERGERRNRGPARPGDALLLERRSERRGGLTPHHRVDVLVAVRVGIDLLQRRVGGVVQRVADRDQRLLELLRLVAQHRFLRGKQRLDHRREQVEHLDRRGLEAALLLVADQRDRQPQVLDDERLRERGIDEAPVVRIEIDEREVRRRTREPHGDLLPRLLDLRRDASFGRFRLGVPIEVGEDAEQRRGAQHVELREVTLLRAQDRHLADHPPHRVVAVERGQHVGDLVPRPVALRELAPRLGARQETVRVGERAEVVVAEPFVADRRLLEDPSRRRDHRVPTTAWQMSARPTVPSRRPSLTTGSRWMFLSSIRAATLAT